MTKLKYTLKNDTLFKMLFVKYPDLLRKLVAVLLGINYDSITQFEIRNPDMSPESLGDKFCRLDISMTVDGQIVDLEIQVEAEADYADRTLFYWSKGFSTALASGKKYSELPRMIVISIVAFEMFDCKEYHSEFMPLEVTRHTPLTDKMVMHYYELPKLPKSVTPDNTLELWLSLFKAETEEELEKLSALEVPEMSQAVEAYRHITVTPEFKEAERLRSKARHDEAQALYNAERNAERNRSFEIAKNMIMNNESTEKILMYTGLSLTDLETLRIIK